MVSSVLLLYLNDMFIIFFYITKAGGKCVLVSTKLEKKKRTNEQLGKGPYRNQAH